MIIITRELLAMGRPVAQGEVLLWAKEFAPKELLAGLSKLKLQPMKLEDGLMIVGHSETGHHHVIEAERPGVLVDKVARAFIDKMNDSVIEIVAEDNCVLRHLRGFDTHEAFLIPPGEYLRAIRSEQFPEGWRRVAD